MKPVKLKKNSKFYFKSKLKIIGGFFFLLFLPTQLAFHYFGPFSYINGVRIDYLALKLYLTDIIFFTLVIGYYRPIIKFVKKYSFHFKIFAILILLNILISSYKIIAIYSWFKIYQLMAIYVIFKKTNIKAKFIYAGFLIPSAVMLMLTLFQFVYKTSVQGLFYYLGERAMNITSFGVAKSWFFDQQILRPYGTFSHPNSLAGFYLLIYGFFLFQTSPKKKDLVIGRGLIITISAMLVLISFSKTAILTFILISIIYAVTKNKLDCFTCILAKIIGLIVIGGIFLNSYGDIYSLVKRVDLIKNSFEIFVRQPFLGIGMNHYLYWQAEMPSKYLYFSVQPVHNIFLLFLTQTGIIITSLTLYFLWQFIKKQKNNLAFIICVFIILLTGFFDHYWLSLQQNLLLIGVIFGMTLNQSLKKI